MASCIDYPTAEDAKDFKRNAESTNEFVTSNENTFTDKDGNVKLTMTGIRNSFDVPSLGGTEGATLVGTSDGSNVQSTLNAIKTGQSAGVIGFATQVDLFANLNFVDGSIGYVTNDSTATNNGTYLKDGASGSGSWIQSSQDLASQAYQQSSENSATLAHGSDEINKGKVAPFVGKTRDGVISPVSSTWNGLILDVKVIGARIGEYYTINYQQNGALLSGYNRYDWRVDAILEDGYETSSTVETLISYFVINSVFAINEQQQLDPNGGVQRIKLYSPVRPEFSVELVIDASALPAANAPINSLSAGASHYSYVIAKENYQYLNIEPYADSILPFKYDQRDGETSSGSGHFELCTNAIVGCTIDGAEYGYRYRIAYFKNGSTALGPSNLDGWIIHKIPVDGWEDPSNAITVHNYNDEVPDIPRDNGKHFVSFQLAAEPAATINITIDTSKLKSYGAFYRSIDPHEPGYSYYLDERFCFASSSLEPLRGKLLPFRQRARNSVESPISSFFYNAIVGCTITGASPDKYYRIAYFKNGSTALGPSNLDGWVIEEHDAATYETSASSGIIIHDYNNPASDIPRDNKVHTVRIKCASKPSTEVVITVDTSKLAPYGQYYKFNEEQDKGYSLHISSRYVTLEPVSETTTSKKGMLVELEPDGGFSVASRSGDFAYRVRMGSNGHNDIFNFRQVFKSNDVDLATAAWTSINAFSTDWLPPMRVSAVNNPTLPSFNIFTGGNHGSIGGTGLNTGYTESVQVYVDGDAVSAGEVFMRYCDSVEVVIVNRVCAMNTVSSPIRYPIRQTFNLDISANLFKVECEVLATENVTIDTEYGCQMTVSGTPDTVLWLDGQYPIRQPFLEGDNSGARSIAPDAWLTTLTNANVAQTFYMDRSYGIGDGSGNLIDAPNSFSSGKFYNGVIRGEYEVVEYPLNNGEKYKWRGGYSFASPTVVTGIDSRVLVDTARRKIVTVFDAKDYT